MYFEVYDISFNFLSFSLQIAFINIIFNTKSLFLISTLLSVSLIAVLGAISNTNWECFRLHRSSAWERDFINKMRRGCIGKEKLYFYMGETAIHNKETKTRITSVTRRKTEKERNLWLVPDSCPTAAFWNCTMDLMLHHLIYLVSWFSSPPSGILGSSCLCLKRYSHYSRGAVFCP